MSEKIRIGNDIDIRWTIVDGEGDPYIMEGRDISIELNVGTKKIRIKEFDYTENTLHFVYYGKDQRYTGSYALKFIENDGNVDMVTYDTRDAFTLVEHSWLANTDPGEEEDRVYLEFATVASALMEKIGPPGPAAGFGEVTASVDNTVGTPSVEVETSGPNTGKNINFIFHNLKGEKGDTGEAAGFNLVTASVDANTGTPSVVVSSSGPDTAKSFDFAFHNLKGEKGDTGNAAGFGNVSASVDANVGTPSIEVSSSGPDTAKVFNFAFHNLKGEKGDTGNAAGFGQAIATVDANTGTPSVEISSSGPDTAKVFSFAFHNIKGEKGDIGNAAGFGEISASVDANVGTPSVEVSSSGPDTAKVLSFAFHNLKGVKGDPGTAAGFGQASASVDANTGTPSVEVTVTGPDTAKVFTFTFHNLKGEKGDTVSAEWGTITGNIQNQTDLMALIEAIQGLEFVPVQTLPTASADTLGKIYLVPASNPQTQNLVDEYYTKDNGAGASTRYTWELFGSASIDLSGLVTDEELATALADYVLSSSITDVLRYSSMSLTTEQKTQARTNIGAGTYSKPSGGIPSSDMASAVQSSLGKADTAYQKPGTGIPKTDLAQGVQDSLGAADTALQPSDISTLESDVSDIKGKIPSAASAQNQLADKNFVNSSIATSTATFKGTYNLVTDLSLTTSATTAQIAAALASAITGEDNNDYAFVQIPTADATPTEISRIDRYKFDGTDWAFEFSLNNSSFTAAQWAAINSGITAALVTAFGAKYDKPGTGIPKSDLAEGVRASLGKADTALQSFTETDPTVPAWAKASTKPTYSYSEIQNTPTIPEFTDYTDAELQTAIDTAFAGL